MNTTTVIGLPLAFVLALFAGSAVATPYNWVDGNGRPVTDGSGNCVNALYYGVNTPSCSGAAAMPAPVAAKPADSDGDGIPDSRDRCPDTPRGSRVDAQGCTVVGDSDGDGVSDDKDLCANTPRGATVNATGCVEKLVVQDLRFASNRAALEEGSKAQLAAIAAKIKSNPAIAGMTISGYTDDRGPADYNQNLSQQRAQAVRSYFIEQGIDGSTIRAVGYGEARPVADNATAAGRAQNRRVEIDFQMK